MASNNNEKDVESNDYRAIAVRFNDNHQIFDIENDDKESQQVDNSNLNIDQSTNIQKDKFDRFKYDIIDYYVLCTGKKDYYDVYFLYSYNQEKIFEINKILEIPLFKLSLVRGGNIGEMDCWNIGKYYYGFEVLSEFYILIKSIFEIKHCFQICAILNLIYIILFVLQFLKGSIIS